MKVGLLTYHWVANFGAQLQTLSTYRFLEKEGCSPIIINWIPEDARLYYVRNVVSSQREAHLAFIAQHFRMTEEFNNPQDIRRIIQQNGITHVVIGSDSLFNIQKGNRNLRDGHKRKPTLDHIFPNPFWGEGLGGIPHIGLSISSQNARYKDFKSQREEICKRIKAFRAITVRDEWTKSMVSYFTHGDIVPSVTPDPVFAFNSNVYDIENKEQLLSKFHLPEKYVLFSFAQGRMKVKTEWLKVITDLFHKQDYTCIWLPKISGGQNVMLDSSISVPLSPLDWYNLIRFSSGYIGVLMHPIVVCLHNAVPFYSFDHYGTGLPLFSKKSSSKIYDILKRADLLQNHFFQRNHILYPPAEKVFRLIMEFPGEQCRRFAVSHQTECLANMNDLLRILTNV